MISQQEKGAQTNDEACCTWCEISIPRPAHPEIRNEDSNSCLWSVILLGLSTTCLARDLYHCHLRCWFLPSSSWAVVFQARCKPTMTKMGSAGGDFHCLHDFGCLSAWSLSPLVAFYTVGNCPAAIFVVGSVKQFSWSLSKIVRHQSRVLCRATLNVGSLLVANIFIYLRHPATITDATSAAILNFLFLVFEVVFPTFSMLSSRSRSSCPNLASCTESLRNLADLCSLSYFQFRS